MKKLVAFALVLLSVAAVFAAGSALVRRQGLHIVGRLNAPGVQSQTAGPAIAPLSPSQLLNVLKLGNIKATAVAGPVHLDAMHLYVNAGNWLTLQLANLDPKAPGRIALQKIGPTAGAVIVSHMAKANTPFVVDFQVANVYPGQPCSVVTSAGGSLKTWTVNGTTHAIVVVFPTSSAFYDVVLNQNSGTCVLRGADVSDVTGG